MRGPKACFPTTTKKSGTAGRHTASCPEEAHCSGSKGGTQHRTTSTQLVKAPRLLYQAAKAACPEKFQQAMGKSMLQKAASLWDIKACPAIVAGQRLAEAKQACGAGSATCVECLEIPSASRCWHSFPAIRLLDTTQYDSVARTRRIERRAWPILHLRLLLLKSRICSCL